MSNIMGKKAISLGSTEPVLTDFAFGRVGGPQRPRREKTESEIVYGTKRGWYRPDARLDLGRDNVSDAARRRSCRSSDTASSVEPIDNATIKSTASTTASEYSPVTQVSPTLRPLPVCLSDQTSLPINPLDSSINPPPQFLCYSIMPVTSTIYFVTFQFE